MRCVGDSFHRNGQEKVSRLNAAGVEDVWRGWTHWCVLLFWPNAPKIREQHRRMWLTGTVLDVIGTRSRCWCSVQVQRLRLAVQVHDYERLIPVTNGMHCLCRVRSKGQSSIDSMSTSYWWIGRSDYSKLSRTSLTKWQLLHGHLHVLVLLLEIT